MTGQAPSSAQRQEQPVRPRDDQQVVARADDTTDADGHVLVGPSLR